MWGMKVNASSLIVGEIPEEYGVIPCFSLRREG